MTTSSPPPVFSERYELIRHIARGGMAQVYLAKDLLLDREVALKVLFPELSVDPAFVRRFRREAQAAASLSHRNIVSIYDWGQGESTYCIVMEYVDGPTLSALAREKPLEARRAASIGADVAAALDFAHGHGVIHRDVKPGNVLLDRKGDVKVADFGIARAVGTKEGLTQTGAVMGTATYFSPEQAQGYSVDARSDVYSLGVVLYEIVAGRAPFTGDNPVSIAYKHVREQPVPLGERVPGIPGDYAAIVAKAMAKNADDRYQSAGELEEDLRRFVAGQPVMAAAGAEATRVVAPTMVGIPDNTMIAPPVTTASRARTVVEGAPAAVVPVEEPHKSRTGLYAALLIALIVVLAVVLFFLGRSVGWWDKSAPTRTVPQNLAGQSAQQATQTLEAAGFSHIAQTKQASTSVQAGNVISTQPPGGTSLKTSKTITLVVSTGPAQVNVPDVTGQQSDAAVNTLKAAGFLTSVKQVPSSSVQSGTVINTDPKGGTKAAQGSTITINVSSGPASVTVPSVAGLSVSTASAKLGALGFNVSGTIHQEASSKYAAGEIVGTDPAAGASEPPGTTVTLYESTGNPMVTVPSLTGDTESAAKAALAAVNLNANFSTEPVSDQSEDGQVISSSPSAGASVASGSTVNVVVGEYTAPSTTSTTSTTTPGSSTSTTAP